MSWRPTCPTQPPPWFLPPVPPAACLPACRPVAVKRLLRQFTELARKEIEVLILSDEHPNVVRCFAMEEDREFVYLALEKCRSTLSDFLAAPAGRCAFLEAGSDLPTPRCLETMAEICRGLAALHERGIVHRDLKPHNVLLTEVGGRAGGCGPAACTAWTA